MSTIEANNARSSVLAVSIVSDRLYYGIWTLPPLRFLYFNIAQSLAVFYGRNRPDYYFTEGLPLLLTTALPFAAVGLWQSLCGPPGSKEGPTSVKDQDNLDHAHGAANTLQHRVLTRLAWTSLIMTFTLSLIAHKEVRFLYPILPSLHLLAARPLSTFLPANAPLSRRAIITLLLSINLLLAAYASQIHQRGVIDVLHHLRHTHEATNNLAAHTSPPTQPHTHNTTVAFLMPCHSTPWRSHLVHPGITAWALTCDPPIDVPLAQRAAYVDEADAFYADPAAWLRTHMADPATIAAGGSRSGQHWAAAEARFKTGKRREWPSRLVFFEGLEGVLGEVLAGSRYAECWRGFNSHWHDDGRRVGDVVVWCLE
jgi:phosphatidylinositol glycan class B